MRRLLFKTKYGGADMKRIVTALIVILTLSLLPFTVSANSPPPAPWYTIMLEDLPEGTFYVDMLIQLPQDDPCYQEIVSDNLPDTFSEDAQILTYCQDGYRSYTFHYRDAISDITPGTSLTVTFCYDRWASQNPDHIEDIENRGDFRLALLDVHGNILKISACTPQYQHILSSTITNTFHYNAAADTLIRQTEPIWGSFLGFLLLIDCTIAVTCLLEVLTAFAFGLRKYGWMILRTNLVSQIIMWLLFLIFGSPAFLTIPVIIVLEIGIYVLEYRYYRNKMQDISRKKCLLYTVTANTVSLVFGPVLMFMIYRILL